MVKDKEFYRTMFKIAIPIALQSLLSFLVVVADDIMVSLTPDGMFAQAAAAQVNSISALVTAALSGLVGGSAVLIAQYWGKKDMERIKQVFAVVMWICCGVALLVVAVLKLFPSYGGTSNRPTRHPDYRLALSYLGIVFFLLPLLYPPPW